MIFLFIWLVLLHLKWIHAKIQGLDDTFASKMQELLGNSLQESDLQPPRKIMEVRSILCQDTPMYKSFSAYY